ncbi:hypothetical protein BDZ85DRAFT_213000, partial [Elsinoe ampelina]
MSLRQEIETWVSALKHYDEHDYDSALHAFHQIADTSKILFNCGVIHATLGEHGKAIDCYSRSTQLDQYLAIAYFQQGVSNFLTGDFEEALANFNDTLLYLRGNRYIDYAQLGLKFKLHSCEALFNRGLCYFYLQQREAGMSDLLFASREKAVPDHNVIDEAIRDRAEGYTVFSIPVGIVYRPNEAKVKNLRTKDYLGRARLIAQQQNNRPERRQLSAQDLSSSLAFDGDGSYAAMHLVRPGLSSRNRQQSEPPLHRAVFPPTPPPEMERPLPSHQRRSSESTTVASQSNTSIRRTTNKPSKLDLGLAAFEAPPNEYQPAQSTSPNFSKPTRPRINTRSASERPTTRPSIAPKTPPLPRRNPSRTGRSPAPTHARQRDTSHHRLRAGSRSRPRHTHDRDRRDRDEVVDDLAPPPPPGPPPTVKRIRVKLHAASDTRYLMISPDIHVSALLELVRTKLGIKGEFKVKMRDEEGDFVTIGDGEDWEMCIDSVRRGAR